MVGADLYLEPDASFAAASNLAREQGDGFHLGVRTIRKRLKEKKLLASVDRKRETVTIRKQIEGSSKDVLHMLRQVVLPDVLAPGVVTVERRLSRPPP